MVVVMIIAILSGISVFAFQGARRQGRDSRRRADLEAIRSAVELFKADCNVYPANSCVAVGSTLSGTSGCGCSPANTNVYIQSIPGDPTSAASYYYNRPTTTTYDLCSHLEDSTAGAPAGCGTCNPTPCRYKVQNP